MKILPVKNVEVQSNLIRKVYRGTDSQTDKNHAKDFRVTLTLI